MCVFDFKVTSTRDQGHSLAGIGNPMQNIYVYILKCGDGTLYTGSTADLAKRLREHNELKSGAKYTRARRPVAFVYQEKCETLARAREREAEIKRMTRREKLALIKNVHH